MDETTFWQMIEQAKDDSGSNDDKQVELLTQRLALLEPDEIIEFDQIYHRYDVGAYRENVWDAAGFIAKGCSDSGFSDFRAWLIAQGREIYERVLRDPDYMADIVPVTYEMDAGKIGDVMGSLWVVAMKAYRQVTGSEMPRRVHILPFVLQADGGLSKDERSAMTDAQEERYLQKRFPRIAAKFWDEDDYWDVYVQRRKDENAQNHAEDES